ncbi:MAG: NAD(P)/FAD-dependent oxidoreductase [Bacillota bacterium]
MYDFIIVGARCAGATTAFFLGKQGYKVLLIDKYTEPGPTLSTHIIGETEIYERLGIKDKMESSGAPLITRMRVDLEGNLFESNIVVTSRVLGLRREILDKYLLEAATSQDGVTTLLNTRVISVLKDHEKVVGVSCKGGNGVSCNYYADIVIGADGARSQIAKSVNAEDLRRVVEDQHAICYAYASEVQPLSIPTMEWYWNKSNIVLCNPIDNSLHCIALIMPPEIFKTETPELSRYFFNELNSFQTLSPRIRNIKLVGTLRGIGKFNSYIRKGYGSGWVLVGDAAALLHPVSGVGIDNAVCTAELLVNELLDYRSGSKSWDEAMEAYINLRDERILPQYDASIKTLSRTSQSLTADSHSKLGLLCTFPGLVKQLGENIDEVLKILN